MLKMFKEQTESGTFTSFVMEYSMVSFTGCLCLWKDHISSILTFSMNSPLRLVGYKFNPPYSNFKGRCWNVNCPNAGADVDFLKLVLQLVGFDFVLLHINASSDDSLKLINNGSADITPNVVRISIDRLKLARFSNPVNYMFYGYFTREITDLHFSERLLDLMEWPVYLLLLLSLLISSLLMIFLYHSRSKVNIGLKEGVEELKEYIFLLITILFKQSPKRQFSGPFSFLVLLTHWIVFSMLIFVFYDTELRSVMLNFVQKGTEFNTFTQVLNKMEKEGWKGALISSGYIPSQFCVGIECDRLEALNKSFYMMKEDDEELLRDELVRGKRMTFGAIQMDMLRDADVVIYDRRRKILFVKDQVMREQFISIAIGKHLPYHYLERINRAVAQVLVSYENIKSRYQEPYPPKLLSFNAVKSSSQIPMTLIQYFNILYASAALIAISIIILVMEITIHRIIERRKREKEPKITTCNVAISSGYLALI